MNRLTLQLVHREGISPDGVLPSSDLGTLELVENIETKTLGHKVFHLSTGATLEIGHLGSIRYSEECGDLSKYNIHAIYNEGMTIIDDLIDRPLDKYKLSVILNSENPSSTFIDHSEEIERFGAAEFSTTELQYTELTDESIKIDFSDPILSSTLTV